MLTLLSVSGLFNTLDIWTVVSFYQDGAYVYMAVMIFLLLGSSVLLQVFSWLWYSDSLDKIKTKVETFAKRRSLIKPFHFLQLGVYLSTLHWQVCWEDMAMYMNQDFQMLRLFETFSESAPQLTLMINDFIQQFISSASPCTAAIASSVAMYHRSMRIYLPEKHKMSWISTGIYFLWNLLVIIPRVTALALFCSVLPCYIIAHFLSLWMLLVLVAWSQKTDYMEHRGWEWLFRAAVGLIWYFCWFNITRKRIKLKMVLYYIFMAVDTVMLLGFWCWMVFEYAGCWSSLNPYVVIPTLLGLYVIGILVKMIYYRCFHPNGDREKITEPTEGKYRRAAAYDMDTDLTPEDAAAAPAQPLTGVLKRSRTMAANFYF
uniref:XK-related protein n=1 Tax=Sinocyclocheilus grahami TaxID=75366 RepID=A0A672KT53_SINGR